MASKAQALTPGPSFTLELPPRVTTGGAGVAAKGTLNVADRAQVKLTSGAFGGVVNLTSTIVTGTDVKTGDIWSKGSVSIGDRTRVTGFVKTGGTLTRGLNTVVTGTIQQNQSLPAPTLTTVSVQFMNGASPLTVANGGTATANPGDYSSVSVGAGGTLNVRAGDYRFDSFTTNPGAILRVDSSAGAVRIFVRQTLLWSGGVTTAGGDASKLLLAYVGTTNTALGGPFIGTLLSPNATLTLQTNSAGYSGGFFAKNLTVQPDVTVTVRPYQALCEGVPVDDQNPCTADACDPVTGNVTHAPLANGTTCSDGNGCTQTDTCQAGVCTGANPVTCTAQDQCHSAGTCSPTTGTCSNPAKANGSACNDGSACTQTDTCQVGVCTGGNAVVCTAQDQCHSVGTCNASTGVCSNPAKPNGSACSDGNACTQADSCNNGSCAGGNPVTCVAQDQCHDAGTCSPATGACTNPAKANGTACNDGNLCTQVDACQAGLCAGSNPVTCVAQDQCHDAGTCNTSTGLCSSPAKPNGTTCNDGNLCTQTDACVSGTCAGQSPVVCLAQDQCHNAGSCSPATGACSNPAKPDGSGCNDGNTCTQTDSCTAGACVGSSPIVCAAMDSCHIAGTCDGATGVCSNPAKPDGAVCSDGNACTQSDSCQAGLCSGSNPVVCTASDACHDAGSCDAVTGTCSNPAKPVGTSCSDGNSCNGSETCSATGACSPGAAPAIDDGNPCTIDACDAAGGVTHSPADVGVSCADANLCNGSETCDGSGQCVQGTPLSLDDGNPCTIDECDDSVGVTHAPSDPGTSCADANVCNGSEACDGAGTCAVGTALNTDDGDPCTLDGCDPTLGVTHSPLPNCGGTRLESRASLMGRVQTSTGAAVTGFTVQVYDAPAIGPASETPRSDVTVSIASDGTFRARLNQFPESTNDRAPPVRVLVRVSGDSFFRLTREALLRPSDVADLGPMVVLARDSKVTSIGPAGGTATDSQGLVEVQIPAGALSQTQAVRITPVTTREQFPTPLPNVTVTMYGVMLEPEGLELAQPGTIRFSNYRNFPTGLTIPFGFVDERTGRWLHDGSGTWDGQRFRASIRHFSEHDLNGAAGGEWYAFVEKGIDTGKSDCQKEVGSSTSFATGALKQSVTLPAVTRGDRSQSITLAYDSGLAASRSYAQPGTMTSSGSGMGGASFLRVPLNGLSVRLSCQSAGSGSGAGCGTGISCVGGTIPGGFISSNYQALGQHVSSQENLGQSEKNAAVSGTYIDLPLAADGSAPEPTFVKVDDVITISNPLGLNLSGGSVSQCVASGGVFGVQAGAGTPAGIRTAPVPQINASRYELAYHRRGAPAGNGWGIAELHEAFVPPDRGHVDLVHGDGYRETFGIRAEAKVVAHAGDGADLLVPKGFPVALARDPVTGEVFFAQLDSSSRRRLGRIQQPSGPAQLITQLAAPVAGTPFSMAVAYASTGRSFAIATSTGLYLADETGQATLLYTRPSTTSGIYDRPSVAAVGSDVYYVNALDDLIYHVDIDDPSSTVTAFSTTAALGDVQLDPTAKASGTWFQTARALAAAPDGSIYVACTNRHTIYRLTPQADGKVGGDSVVTRVVGNGTGLFAPEVGTKAPALIAGVRVPHQLSVSPEGYLYIVSPALVLRYDPTEQSVQWLAADIHAPLKDFPLFDFSENGSILGMSPTAFYAKADSLVVFDTQHLVSDIELTRTADLFQDQIVVTDPSSDVVETYRFTDATRRHALLFERRLRTGRLILRATYDDAGHPITLEDGDAGTTHISYDAGGKLASIEDAAGRVTSFDVDEHGDLVRVDLPGGDSRQFTYTDGRMGSARDPRGQVSTYTYSDRGTLETATKPSGEVSTVTSAFSGQTYGANGEVTWKGSYTDPHGVAHEMTADVHGNIVQETFTADGQLYTVQTTPAASLVGGFIGPNSSLDRRNILGQIASSTLNGVPASLPVTYDASGRVLTENTPSNSRLFTFGYTAEGRPRSIAPSVQRQQFFDYDSAGRLARTFEGTSATSVSGLEQTFGWSSDDRLVSYGHHSITGSIAYDSVTGNAKTISDPTGSDTFTFDAAGNIATENDGVRSLAYTYDAKGRLSSATDALGNVTQLGYTAAGCGCSSGDLVSSIHTPDLEANQSWLFAYDAGGRISVVTDPTGAADSFTYSNKGDLVQARDRLNRVTFIDRDSLGRPSKTTDPAGRVGTTAYPVPTAGAWQGPALLAASPDTTPAATSLTASLRDGEYQVGYNGFGWPGYPAAVELYRDATIELGFGTVVDSYARPTYRRDRAGLAFDSTAVSSSLGGTLERAQMSYQFDTHKPVLTSTLTGWPPNFTESTSNVYNGNLELTSSNGWASFNRFSRNSRAIYDVTRDSGGRVATVGTRYAVTIGSQTNTYSAPTTTYTYAPTTGYLTTRAYGAATGTFHAEHQLGYDARGLLSSLGVTFTRKANLATDAGVFHFGYDEVGRSTTLDSPIGASRTQTYDALGRLTRRCYSYAGGVQRCYGAIYDAVGKPTVLTDPEGETDITYDTLDRVSSVHRLNGNGTEETETYAYNALGGFTTFNGSAVDDQRPRKTGAGTAGAAVPASVAGQAITLDAIGRLSAATGSTFTYGDGSPSPLDRIVQGTIGVTYSHDAFGRLACAANETNLSYLCHVPEAGQTAEDFGITGSGQLSLARWYVWDPNDIDHPLWTFDVAQNLAVHYELDTLGNVRRLFGSAFNETTHAFGPLQDLGGYRYAAFGALKPSDSQTPAPTFGGVAYDQPLRWQGRPFETLGGVYDFRNRVWNPTLGVFLQPDLYQYLGRTGTVWSWPGQNPYQWRDPTGRYEGSYLALRAAQILRNFGPYGAGAAAAAAAGYAFGYYALGPDFFAAKDELLNRAARAEARNRRKVKCPTAETGGSGGAGKMPPTSSAAADDDDPGAYRARYNRYLRRNGVPELPSEWDAHHRIPQEFRGHPEFEGFDFDAPENIRGVSSSRNNGFNVHQEITEEWGGFRADNPGASRAQIEGFAEGIDARFGHTYW